MKHASAIVVAAFLAAPAIALADTYQLWLEVFDESRGTTTCKYRSSLGKDGVTEHSGRYLCPRVACRIPPPEDRQAADECLSNNIALGDRDQRAGPPPVRL